MCLYVEQDDLLTAVCLQYGSPLIPSINFIGSFMSIANTNTIYTNPNSKETDEQAVIRPNVDTSYSIAYIDLSESDLVLNVPEFPDRRYHVFPFYDL